MKESSSETTTFSYKLIGEPDFFRKHHRKLFFFAKAQAKPIQGAGRFFFLRVSSCLLLFYSISYCYGCCCCDLELVLLLGVRSTARDPMCVTAAASHVTASAAEWSTLLPQCILVLVIVLLIFCPCYCPKTILLLLLPLLLLLLLGERLQTTCM